MWNKIEVDGDLIQGVVSRYRLTHACEAIHLALRALLGETHDPAGQLPEDEYDEFRDLSAWQPRRRRKRGDALTMETPWVGVAARQAVPSFRPAARLVATGERPP